MEYMPRWLNRNVWGMTITSMLSDACYEMVLAVLNGPPPGRGRGQPSPSMTRSISASPVTVIICDRTRGRSRQTAAA